MQAHYSKDYKNLTHKIMINKIYQELNGQGQQLELVDIYHELKRILLQTNYDDKATKEELKEKLNRIYRILQ